MDRDALDQALLDAHARHDTKELVRLYTMAGDEAEHRQDVNAACFYLTHAYVFAFESGATEAKTLNIRLADKGRANLIEF